MTTALIVEAINVIEHVGSSLGARAIHFAGNLVWDIDKSYIAFSESPGSPSVSNHTFGSYRWGRSTGLKSVVPPCRGLRRASTAPKT